MKYIQRATRGLSLAGLLACGGWACALPAPPAPALPSADEVIRKAVTRDRQKETGGTLPAFSYRKVTVTEEFDFSGRIKERKERLYQVSFKDGFTSARLLQVNGHAPEPSDLKRQAEYDTDARLLGSQSQAGKGDRRESLLTPELAARYEFTMRGQCQLNGRRAYEITFHPKTPAPPVRHIVDRLLNRISGTLWIDAEEFEIARADLRLGSEVDLLGGVVGCLRKLEYTLTRTRMACGVWLNSCSSGDFEGRRLLESMRIKTRSQSANFQAQGVPS